MSFSRASIEIRRLWPTEAEAVAVAAHLLRLEHRARRWRFLAEVDDAALIAHAALVSSPQARMVGGFQTDGALVALGELLLPDGRGDPAGEIAITVEAGYRKGGIGTELVRRLVRKAQNHAVRSLTVRCAGTNGAMRALARKVGASIAHDGEDAVATIVPPPGSLMSLLAEAYEDGAAIALMAARELTRSTAAGMPATAG